MLQRMQPLRDKDLQRLSARKHRLEEAEAKDGRKRKAEVLGNGGHGGHGLNAWDAGAKLVGLGFGVFFFGSHICWGVELHFHVFLPPILHFNCCFNQGRVFLR
jgi:predicted GNAT superfamily acetyltransferase